MRHAAVSAGIGARLALSRRALLVGVGLGACAAVAQAAQPSRTAAAKKAAPAPILEQRALDLLKAASDRLGAAQTMRFTALASYEYPSRLGPPILYTMRYDVVLQRPDGLKVVIPGDGAGSEFTFDGKDIVAFVPDQNLVAITPAPPTLEGALRLAYQAADVYFPFTDVLLPDAYTTLTEGARLVYLVGPSNLVGDTLTDSVVVAADDIFMQVWIGREDKLPRRIRALYPGDRRGLRHELELSNWQIDAPVDAQTFATDRARAGQPMAFAVPGPKMPVRGAAAKKLTRPAAPAASAAR